MNILVSNLSINIIDADLRRLFNLYGEVEFVSIARDKNNGRSMGNAVIEMPLYKQGTQAIISLDNTVLDGKRISVSEINYRPGKSIN